MKLATTVFASLTIAASASASLHFEGFEDPTWTQGGDNWQRFVGGDIVRVATGTNGITSSDGTGHGIMTNLTTSNDVFGDPSLGARAAFTRLGGYSSSFGGGFAVSQDIYLDTNWNQGQGFDFSTAVNKQDGTHLRDFIWHVGVTAEGLQVNHSNNSDLSFNDGKISASSSFGNVYDVGSTGWYTFETIFVDDGNGFLSVTHVLKDDNGNTVYSSNNTTSDVIATEVGGNRYGYFTYNNIDGLAIDNTSLSAIPMPTPLALAGAGLIGITGMRRRRA